MGFSSSGFRLMAYCATSVPWMVSPLSTRSTLSPKASRSCRTAVATRSMEAGSSVWVATSSLVDRPCMSVVESTASCSVPRS